MKYKIEIFNKDFVNLDFATVENIDLRNDYLVSETFEIIAEFRYNNFSNGEYVYITDYLGNHKFTGLLINSRNENNNNIITVGPIIDILNVETLVNLNQTYSLFNFENFLKEKITEELINNIDELQNIKGLTINTLTSTNGTYIFEDEINKIKDIILNFFYLQNIIFDIKLNPEEKTIDINIFKNTKEKITIELNNNWIADLLITDNEETPINKLITINKETKANIIYYKYLDGTFGIDNINRIYPVNYKYEILANENFEAEGQIKAAETFATEYNNNITFTINKDNKILKVEDFNIGDKVNLIYNNKTIESILTGINENNNLYSLEFGNIRISLTKILKRG